jgi:hypothetical protein
MVRICKPGFDLPKVSLSHDSHPIPRHPTMSIPIVASVGRIVLPLRRIFLPPLGHALFDSIFAVESLNIQVECEESLNLI